MASRKLKLVELRALVKDTELVGIKLVELKSSLRANPEEGKAYGVNVKMSFPFTKNGSNVVVLCKYGMNFTDDKGNDVDIVDFRCVFALDYIVDNISNHSDDTIKTFADNNSKFNSWSYFRELLSSIAMRMEIGGLVAPLLKPRPPEPALKK